MTVEREDDQLPSIVCDGCGVRVVLDIEPEASDGEIAEAVADLGWRRDEPERVKFNEPGFRRHGAVFEQDFCVDCQDDEPGPRPKFGSGRVARPATVGAFENDPCDEWPRELVFAAVGLRPDCGHPRGPVGECGWCRSGYPIGSTTPGWKR